MIWLRALGVMLLAIPVLFAKPAASGSPVPPNIVVVLVDDLRWDDIAIAVLLRIEERVRDDHGHLVPHLGRGDGVGEDEDVAGHAREC